MLLGNHVRTAAMLSVLLLAGVAHADAVDLPNGQKLQRIDFERHVASLLGRLGCSSGSCHGSFQGKGGLTLSLFGYSPDKDHEALTRSGLGRRINFNDPDASLLLLKATAQVPHQGGKRLDRGSWHYQVLRRWIEQGARFRAGSGTVRGMEIVPREHAFRRPGESVQCTVLVEFADGRKEDMTPFCDIRAQDDSIAVASASGEVTALAPGDTALIVTYRGNIASGRVLVPAPVSADFAYPEIPAANFIDRIVFDKLRRLNIVPSELCGDAEFLRRISLDAGGRLPSPAEVRAFLADDRVDKRQHKIDELLANRLHAALWAMRWCDITGNNVEAMEDQGDLAAKRSKMWHDWLRLRFANNMPYDRIVHGILCATSRDGKEIDEWVKGETALLAAASKGFDTDYARRPSLDLFWRRLEGDDFFPLDKMAERTAVAFLGVRLECAQCHKHPFDRWTQTDYRAFANIFAQTKFGSSPQLRAELSRQLDLRRQDSAEKQAEPLPHLREVYVSNDNLRRFADPRTGQPLSAKALGGPEIALEGDAREKLFEWMVDPRNPYFARSFVNRVWAHYFGRGLVEPVDNLSAARPASNEQLLDALASEFRAHRFDIRWLERAILQSRTYQLSSVPREANAGDRRNFSHALPRRLMAEVVVDALDDALGSSLETGPDVPIGSRAIEVAPSRLRNATLMRVFRVFGRPARTALCDCERPSEPALPQSLFLMSDPGVLRKIESGRLAVLLERTADNGVVLEELFLATLSRFPTEGEKRAALKVLEEKERKAAFVDIVWALINTREFVLNH